MNDFEPTDWYYPMNDFDPDDDPTDWYYTRGWDIPVDVPPEPINLEDLPF